VSPSISVVIPNYNYGIYLEIAIKSCLDQTLLPSEIIVIDNFSQDDSKRIVEGFRDSRIKFLTCDNGGSIARSRNFGASIATSTFLAFLDADDVWFRRKLELQVRAMTEMVGLSYHSVSRFGKRGGVFRAWDLNSNSPLESLLSGGNPIVTSSVMIRREIFTESGGFPENPELFAAEDYALWLNLASNNVKFRRLSNTLAGYRVHNSASTVVDNTKATELAAIPHLNGAKENVKAMHAGFLAYSNGVQALANGNLNAARKFFADSIAVAHFRFRWRAAVNLLRTLKFRKG
jgi:teichuronic acid biosynthesis glycosyltransferase TuaG